MEIEEWLNSLGLQEYTRRFIENDIDSELLPKLTNEDLKELGIESLGHRRKILNAIAALCVEPPPKPAPQPSPEPTRKSEPSSAAERRQLTVVFCDLVS